MDPLAIAIILVLLFCYYIFIVVPHAKAARDAEYWHHERKKDQLREEIVRLKEELERMRADPTTPPKP